MTHFSRRGFLATAALAAQQPKRPNFLFILTDDQRFDALGCAGNPHIQTPNMDALARRGIRFTQGSVTMAVCSASRAAILTGHYGSRNGVLGLDAAVRTDEMPFPELLRRAGYRTGYAGKWHLRPPDHPEAAGFETASWFYANGEHFNRKVTERGVPKTAAGFVEDYLADQAVAFLRDAARDSRPFFFHLATQLPHMDNEFRWNARPVTLARYDAAKMPLPASWRDDKLEGKPAYLRECRNRTQALQYGYAKADAVREHKRQYYAAITELDAALGRVFAALRELGLESNTYICFMGDNGWFLGEHKFTSKVLAYEESVRVPFIMAGPNIRPAVREELVLNVDWAPTICDLAGVNPPAPYHGRSLRPLFEGPVSAWRDATLYEALRPELGSKPILAVRTSKWKYIQTLDPESRSKVEFEELYDLETDPAELHNLAPGGQVKEMRERLKRLRAEIS